jgi:hypothetical protein
MNADKRDEKHKPVPGRLEIIISGYRLKLILITGLSNHPIRAADGQLVK